VNRECSSFVYAAAADVVFDGNGWVEQEVASCFSDAECDVYFTPFTCFDVSKIISADFL
jgi:hypothetical protein